MGLFLTNKDKASKTKSAKRKDRAWDPARTMQGVRLLLLFAVVLAAVIGWRWGEGRLMAYASQKRGATITPDRVELVTDRELEKREAGIAAHLGEIVASHVSGDPLDGSGLERAGRALLADPWVREVRRVRRVSRGSRGGRAVVVVELSLREPLARVRDADGVWRIVSVDGVWLPDVDRVDLPRVTGVTSEPPAGVGERWEGEDIVGVLSLVELLRDQSYADQIAEYDASERTGPRGRLRLVLHTTRGGLVRWGLPPNQNHLPEVSTQVKLRHLEKTAEYEGWIDYRGLPVEVFRDRIIEIRPGVGE